MLEFFVWSAGSPIRVIEAASEQDAAEAFLEQPVTLRSDDGSPPVCFVQPAGELYEPRANDNPLKYWINRGEPPQ